jgi:CDGSH-type Zn-finger protein
MAQRNLALARVQIARYGPYRVSGSLPLSTQVIGTDSAGDSVEWRQGKSYPPQEQYALCRCGHSQHKPFCDGTHAKVGFDGTETASRAPYREQAKAFKGPATSLTDARALCASGRFCDANASVWKLVHAADQAAARQHFVRQTGNCPSGRLVAWDDATGAALEPKHEPSITLIEDPARGCSGPIGLRGGVRLVGADGFEYEARNRMTLCRCGGSKNKPFCDGAHLSIQFSSER